MKIFKIHTGEEIEVVTRREAMKLFGVSPRGKIAPVNKDCYYCWNLNHGKCNPRRSLEKRWQCHEEPNLYSLQSVKNLAKREVENMPNTGTITFKFNSGNTPMQRKEEEYLMERIEEILRSMNTKMVLFQGMRKDWKAPQEPEE